MKTLGICDGPDLRWKYQGFGRLDKSCWIVLLTSTRLASLSAAILNKLRLSHSHTLRGPEMAKVAGERWRFAISSGRISR